MSAHEHQQAFNAIWTHCALRRTRMKPLDICGRRFEIAVDLSSPSTRCVITTDEYIAKDNPVAVDGNVDAFLRDAVLIKLADDTF